METEHVGERIAQLRRSRGWTQTQLVAGLPLSPSYVSLIESGRRQPRQRALEMLAERLGCTLDYLRTGRGGDTAEALVVELRFAELALRSGDARAARDRFAATLSRAESFGPSFRAEVQEALWGLSRANVAVGELTTALRGFESLDREPALAATISRVGVKMALCRTYLECGDLGRAIDVGEAALRELGADDGTFVSEEVAELASTLVFCYYERGDLTRAQMLVQAIVDGAERNGSLRARAAAYWNAAMVAEGKGDLRAARTLTERALALYGEVGNGWAVASLRVNTAWLMLQLPEPDTARADEILQQALSELSDVGAPTSDVATAETQLARCRLLDGDVAAALDIARGAVDRVLSGPPLEAARARAVLADALLASGDDVAAIDEYLLAASDLERVGACHQAVQVWRQLAEALLRLGRTDSAIDAYRRLADAAGAPAHPHTSAGATVGAR